MKLIYTLVLNNNTGINYAMEVGDGSIKTIALRGVKDNPPYLHEQRLVTLDDAVEFFNLVLGDNLTAQENQDQVAFMRALVSGTRSGNSSLNRARAWRRLDRNARIYADDGRGLGAGAEAGAALLPL
jgi:hypothetical protein